MKFEELGLSAGLLRAVSHAGYSQPTPIQAAAIPAVLAGRDVMAAAQTGTGKTAGFTLPLLQHLDNGTGNGKPRALVLVPTRELAAQVADSVRIYGSQTRLRCLTIFGGVNINPQIAGLRRGADILVATPGRLLDHLAQGTVDLSGIGILVLDEADRMLDMGFIHDIRRLLKHLPARRQNLLFSATFSDDIRKLARGVVNDAVEVDVAPRNSTADTVSQLIHPVNKEDKAPLLSWLIGDGNWQQVLVFTRTKRGADRLARHLEADGLRAGAIHGNKSQNARTKALDAFKHGRLRVLVATDIAARGLDIDQLPHVVNYEIPNVPEDYVHRIGRTGRAGRDGQAVSLVCVDERVLMRDIEKLLGRELPHQVVDGFEPDLSRKPEPIFKQRGQRAAKPKDQPRTHARPARGHADGNRRPAGKRSGNPPRRKNSGPRGAQRRGGGSTRPR